MTQLIPLDADCKSRRTAWSWGPETAGTDQYICGQKQIKGGFLSQTGGSGTARHGYLSVEAGAIV